MIYYIFIYERKIAIICVCDLLFRSSLLQLGRGLLGTLQVEMMFRNPRFIQDHLTLFITMSRTLSHFFNLLCLLGLLGINKESFTNDITDTSGTSNENSVKNKAVNIGFSPFFSCSLLFFYLQLNIEPRTSRFSDSDSSIETNNTSNSFLIKSISTPIYDSLKKKDLHQPSSQQRQSIRALQEQTRNRNCKGFEEQSWQQESYRNEWQSTR